jgi:hypothetical protein
VHYNRWSSSRDAEFRSLKRQGDGEVDFDVTHAPLDEQVSNMDVSVQVQQPKAQHRAARTAAGGLTGHHVVVDGVSASWARSPRTRAGALAQKAAPGRTQELSSAYLEDQGINTGEEWNHVFDHRVSMGAANPSVFFAAGREKPDLQPNPPATAHPAVPTNKLTHAGVYTGTEHQQWDDNMIPSKGMEEPYSFGASPTREWDSPSRRAGSWGVFKSKAGSMAMLAQSAQQDLQQVPW